MLHVQADSWLINTINAILAIIMQDTEIKWLE